MATQAPPGRRKVLFLSLYQIRPPLSGGTLRTFALANALRRRGLDVFVYSFVARKSTYLSRQAPAVETWPSGAEGYVDRRTLWFLVQHFCWAFDLPPAWITAYLRAAARSPGGRLLPGLLRERLRRCDVVLADTPFLHPIFEAGRGRLRVVNTHNVEHQAYRGPLGWKDRRCQQMVRDIEIEGAGACDVLVSCSRTDQQFFEANAKVRRSILVPNGVDLERFRGIERHRAPTRRALGIADDVRLFLFTASKYGPNREAFDYLAAFAASHERLLEERKIHLLVVGNVVPEWVRRPGFTATGSVEAVEPYFAAADAALNPISTGAGTNVKMAEFIAARLPILTTPFGARGFRIEDGETGFVFEKDDLATTLGTVAGLFETDPSRLRQIADRTYAGNEKDVDMDACVADLAEAMGIGGSVPPGATR